MPEAIPIACSVDPAKLPDRGEQMAELGQMMTAMEADGREAKLSFPISRRNDVEDFIRAESSCCPFFEFSLAEGDDLELSVSAPDGGDWAVRGLVAGFAAGWGGLVRAGRPGGPGSRPRPAEIRATCPARLKS
ncbi:hypothetical protein HJD18_15770 [Thermoleophilia bacterium SCSIO 60948]|nr:hypothetical protein HJD18_15770 [Thermoleophilia bacterium SCSIO 60948]